MSTLPPKLTPKEAHQTTRQDALHCQGCGVAVAIVIEIPRPTPEQVADAKRVMAALHLYAAHGLAKLVPVEDHAERKVREKWRRTT